MNLSLRDFSISCEENFESFLGKLFSVIIVLGLWLCSVSAYGQITTLNTWTNQYHGTSTAAQNVTYAIPAGSSTRLLAVAIASSRTTTGSRTVTLTYGGQALTSVVGDMASTNRQQHTQLYYLNEAGIDAATNTTLSFTVSNGTTRVTDVFVAVFDGVDQTSPITDSENTSNVATPTGSLAFGTALNVGANDLAVEIISSMRTGNTTPRTITYATNWTMASEQTYTTTDGVRNAVASRSIPVSATTDVSTTTFSGTALGSMTALSLRAYVCTPGNQTDYGTNSWIGYVYDGANNFQSANYLSRITEAQNFDELFGGDLGNFPLGTGCTVDRETFSVRFRMALNVTTCGVYPITIGGDDGVRLSVDGGTTWESNAIYSDHAYTELTQDIYLDAGINYLVLEYYENATNNRVRFNMGAMTGVLLTGGKVGSDQTLCQTSIDPALLTSISAARDCAGNTPTYQWQYSATSTFASTTDVGGNSATYDPPSQPVGTRYYRRRAVLNGITVYSNTITILAESPQGDQTTAGNNTWRGYVYDGANNFTTNYLGYITAAQTFDYSFCGDNCTEPTTGCGFNTETFTVRYKMSFIPSTTAGYTFTIGADDGVRLSIDGGSTYIVGDWADHGYQEVSSAVVNLTSGNTYNLVLDYYENGGGNRVKFSFATGPLPVTWSFLDGYYDDGKNMLEWRTASEKNNSGFVVERSLDGVEFDSLGFVSGNGTTLLPQTYGFVDVSPGHGWNYYRLKQIDYDNAFEYSKIIPVHADADREPGIYPNPASSSLYISHGASSPATDAQLLNAQTGQAIPLVHDEKQPARYPLDGIPTGSYIVSFTVDGRRYNEKVVVVK